jgi:hypothetical protein
MESLQKKVASFRIPLSSPCLNLNFLLKRRYFLPMWEIIYTAEEKNCRT